MKKAETELEELILEITELVDGEIHDGVRRAYLYSLMNVEPDLREEYVEQLFIKRLIASRKRFLCYPHTPHNKFNKLFAKYPHYD